MTISIPTMGLCLRLVTASGIAYLFYRYGADLSSDRLQAIAGVIAGVSGTLLGFLITAMAILTAVMDRTLIVNMKKTGHYNILVGGVFTTCGILLAVVALSIFSLFLSGTIGFWMFIVVVFFFSLAMLYTFESGRRFSAIISVL